MEMTLAKPEANAPTILFLSEVSDNSWPAALAEAFPSHRVVTKLDDADPAETVAAIVWNHPYGALAAYRNLDILINLGAGVDHIIGDPDLPAGVPIVRLVDPGMSACMAEYVLTHCLSLHRRLPELREAQAERRWDFFTPSPASAACIGVLGFGKLGRACADLLSTVGFEVIGWKRTSAVAGEYEVHFGEDGLKAFCARADIIVVLLPLTAGTRNLLNRDFFKGVRAGAALINVGRGDLLVEEDLLAALDDGRLRRAVLDVFTKEPLPVEHPFWTHPKITISPHNASATNPATALEQVSENVRRAFAGEPLLNKVDPAAGY